MQAENFNVIACFQLGLQRVCRLRFIVFDADISLIETEDFHDDAKTCKHLFRHLPHEPVVGCNVGFALGGVDNDGVNFADTAGNLHMGGEGSAAHTGDACLVNDLRELFRAQRIDGLPRFDIRAQSVDVYKRQGGDRAGLGGGDGCAGAGCDINALVDPPVLHGLVKDQRVCAEGGENFTLQRPDGDGLSGLTDLLVRIQIRIQRFRRILARLVRGCGIGTGRILLFGQGDGGLIAVRGLRGPHEEIRCV